MKWIAAFAVAASLSTAPAYAHAGDFWCKLFGSCHSSSQMCS